MAAMLAVIWGTVWTATPVQGRPETIRPGISYYSDDYAVTGGVADLVGEKNYEEVYRNFEYYEAVYDGQGRVVRFIAYKRGEEDWRERYLYGPSGRAYAKEVTQVGGGKRRVPLDGGK